MPLKVDKRQLQIGSISAQMLMTSLVLLMTLVFSTVYWHASKHNRADISNLKNQQSRQQFAASEGISSKIDQLTMDLTKLKKQFDSQIPSNLKGEKGDQGAKGETGSRGTSGTKGDIGPTGAKGGTGAQGSSSTPICSYGNCLSLQTTTLGTKETGNINISGTAIAASFSGSGANLNSVDAATLQGSNASYFTNASNISSGSLNAARIGDGSLSYTKLSLSGSVTNADLAGSISDSKFSTISTAGKVADSALSSNVALLNGTGPQTFTGNNKFTGTLLSKNASNSTSALLLQNAAGVNLIAADTTGTGAVTVSALGSSSYSDEFNSGGPTAGSQWTFTTPDSSTYNVNSTTSGKLHFTSTTSNHDCYPPTYNCLTLFETPPSGDFQAEVKVDTTPTNLQAPGITAYQDSNSYIRFEYEYTSGSLHYLAHKVISGTGTANLLDCAASSASVYLRVNRTGNTWSLSYSTDGSSFTTCGSFSQALNLASGTAGVGPTYNSGTGAAAFSGDIDYFRLSLPNSGTFKTTTTNLFQNSADSSTSFQVQNAAATTILGIDTANNRIFSTIANSATAVGFTLNTPSYTTSGAKLLSLQNNAVEKFAIDKDGRIVTNLVPNTRVTHSGTQNITTSTLTKLNFDTERFDTDSLHDTVTNNTRLTASVAGKYLIFATITFQSNSTGVREIAVKLNNTDYIQDDIRTALSGFDSFASVSGVYQLAASDYIEIEAWQNSGGTLTTTLNAKRAPEFGMTYLGP